MGHYAFINQENEVVEVIVGKDEDDLETLPEEFSSWEEFYETQRDGLTCKRTSYNTTGNTHRLDGTAFRGNYASIDGLYDPENDVFYTKQPYLNCTISEETNWIWTPPVESPSDANLEFDTSLPVKNYIWSEEVNNWVMTHQMEYDSETETWEIIE